jgi:F-box/WD-40 domain protein MET30
MSSHTPAAPFSFVPRSPPRDVDLGPIPSPLPAHLTSSSQHARSPSQSRVSPSLASPDAAVLTASLSQLSQHLGPKSLLPGNGATGGPHDDAMQGIILRNNSPDPEHDGDNQTGMDVEDELRRGPPTSDTPGGDCKNVCVRHARMANGATNLMLQKVRAAFKRSVQNGADTRPSAQSIENLGSHEQQAVNTIWSLFSSAPAKRRLLILRGLLTIACPSQLSFLQEALALEMRIDPVEVLPREVTLKVFGYLDAISLGRAAQVSRAWKGMADDDLLWRTMCEQHIERKCEKCGWGLPLLGERRRKARLAMNALPSSRAGETSRGRDSDVRRMLEDTVTSALQAHAEHAQLHHERSPYPHDAPSSSMNVDTSSASASDSHRHKRSKTSSPTPSRPQSPSGPRARQALRAPPEAAPTPPLTRPWKHVYCERLAIERNWRRGTCSATVLSGHTDSITCLQVAEDLPHPSFPVLMTGSWDRSVRIWNLETGKEVGILRGHTRGVRALQFDALKLVTGSMDSTLKIWNWRTGECMRTLRGHRDAVICLTYDKQLLVSGSGDSTIRVWDFGTGEVYSLRGHSEWVNSVALWDSKSDGCEPASSSAGGTPLAGVDTVGAPISNPELAKQSAMGKYLFSASDDATIRVWDLYTRSCVRVLSGHVAQVQSLKIYIVGPNEAGQQAQTAFPDSLLEPPSHTPAEEREEEERHLRAANATARPDCTANQRLPQVPAPGVPIFASPSTGSSTSSSSSNLVGGVAGAGQPASTSRENDFEFPHDKKPMVVSASLDNTVRVWNVEKAQCVRQQFGHLEGVWSVDVDKLRIVSGSHDRTIKIWDRDSGKNLHTMVGHKAAV